MRREPAVTIGALTAIAAAIIGMLPLFGVPLSKEQAAALATLAGLVLPVVQGFLTRRHVTPAKRAHDPNLRANQ